MCPRSVWREELQLGDRLGQGGVVGHPLVDHPDHAASVDQVGDAAAAVPGADRAVVGEQRKTQIQRCGEVVMGLQGVGTYAQDLGVELFKVFDIALKSLQFDGSARGEVFRVEGQHHRTLLDQLAEHDLALGGGHREVGCPVADLEGGLLVGFVHGFPLSLSEQIYPNFAKIPAGKIRQAFLLPICAQPRITVPHDIIQQ